MRSQDQMHVARDSSVVPRQLQIKFIVEDCVVTVHVVSLLR